MPDLGQLPQEEPHSFWAKVRFACIRDGPAVPNDFLRDGSIAEQLRSPQGAAGRNPIWDRPERCDPGGGGEVQYLRPLQRGIAGSI